MIVSKSTTGATQFGGEIFDGSNEADLGPSCSYLEPLILTVLGNMRFPKSC